MLFDRPTLTVLIIYATFPNLAALAFANWLGKDVFSFTGQVFVGFGSLYAIAMEVAAELAIFNANLTTGAPRKPEAVNEPKRYENLNKPLYNQATPLVRIDSVRLFNRALIDQRNGNLEIRMDETFWLKKTDGMDEHRWAHIGGQGRNEFVDMMERGIKYGAYKQVGGQGKRVPDDWQKIRALERGAPLPRYDTPPG